MTPKTTKGRAAAAARMLKRNKPFQEDGQGLGRAFDACFGMRDGAEVKRLLIEMAARDPELLAALRRHRHQTGPWHVAAQAEADRLRAAPASDRTCPVDGSRLVECGDGVWLCKHPSEGCKQYWLDADLGG